ncbi:MAG: C1 family peptidase, partial [Lentisphaerota bacterium]
MKITHGLTLIPMVLLVLGTVASAQVREADLSAMRQIGDKEDWSFTVGKNPATERPLDELCGLVEPPGWREKARFVSMRTMSAALPTSFDWRTSGLTPIKNQANCGSCWAFATVGCLENAIKLKEGITVDLSEQWLVSCNRNSWGCGGGWFAHNYHLRTGGSSDSFGGNGAPFEADFPYTATDATCRGPYAHRYWINGWAYIGGEYSIPSVSAIKQAIMTYGPISVGVYVSSAFQAYSGGVFNRNEDRAINHAVVLVGWDDSQGAGGVWILRNSWGSGWGENGYMKIEYGCCRVGYAACYIDYQAASGLQVTPSDGLTARGPVGGPFTPVSQSYSVSNNSSSAVNWSASKNQSWLDIAPSSGALGAGQAASVIVSVNAAANSLAGGLYSGTVTFTNRSGRDAQSRSVMLRCGQVDYLTELFDSSANDLAGTSYSFSPAASSAGYTVFRADASSFGADPAGGAAVTLPDDGSVQVTLSGGSLVSLYGTSYASFYIGANGYVTFGGGDSTWTESLDNHFNRPRVSALFDDLNPAVGGTVSWKQLSDRVAVTWSGIHEYGAATTNSFQIELFFNGKIRLTYLGLAARDGLASLSRGSGAPPDFEESDFSSYPLAPVEVGALQVALSPVG